MKRDIQMDKDIIHRLLDGDASPEDREMLKKQIEADPALKEEYEGLVEALRVVGGSERKPVPAFFTAEVMKRLPRRKPAITARLRDFFLTARTLRWNMATALAMTAIIVLLLVQVVRLQNRPAGVPVASTSEDQIVTVAMQFYAPQARQVSVAGTFNKWQVDADVLKRQENGIWTINIPMKPGVYTYMFIVDGTAWVPDPKADAYRDDGFGYKNSVLRVGI